MQYVLGVNILYSLHNLLPVPADGLLVHVLELLQPGLQVLVYRNTYSVGAILHEDVLIALVLEAVVQVHHIGVRK